MSLRVVGAVGAALLAASALGGGDALDVETCTQAIELQPLGAADLAATYSNRGLLRSRLGLHDEALADHRKAIHIAPELGSLYVNRANSFMRAGRLRDAGEDLDRAVALGGDSLAAAYYTRSLIFQRLGDRRAARADAERAAALAPDSGAYRSYAAELAAPEWLEEADGAGADGAGTGQAAP